MRAIFWGGYGVVYFLLLVGALISFDGLYDFLLCLFQLIVLVSICGSILGAVYGGMVFWRIYLVLYLSSLLFPLFRLLLNDQFSESGFGYMAAIIFSLPALYSVLCQAEIGRFKPGRAGP